MSYFSKFENIGKHDDRQTPPAFYDKLNEEFHFDYDPSPLNPKGLRTHDGLGDWPGKSIFVNPPYSQPRPWIEKAIHEQKNGKLVVMLLRADTSTKWFHDLIVPNAEVRFVRGRLIFHGDKPANFANLLAIFHPQALNGK